MKIGFINLGAVDAMSDQEVETRFFAFGLPILPLQSYVMSNEEKVCEIPLHFKSIFYGYIRVYMASITCLALAQYFIIEATSNPIPMIMCFTIWIITLIGGNLSKKDKLICELMGSTCQVYLHPFYMSNSMASEYLQKMEATWEAHKEIWGVGDWREVSLNDFGYISGGAYVVLFVISLLDDRLEPTRESKERVEQYFDHILQNYTV